MDFNMQAIMLIISIFIIGFVVGGFSCVFIMVHYERKELEKKLSERQSWVKSFN